jgi:thiamine pyrophosphokinase
MMTEMTDSKWLIVANGEKLSTKRLQALSSDRCVLACDGAVFDCLHQGVMPSIVLGDFDSYPMTLDHSSYEVIHAPNQDQTDSEKGLLHLVDLGVRDILLCQAIGDRTDHSLINLGLLARYGNLFSHLALARENEVIHYVRDKTITIEGEIGDPVAILGFPEATIKTEGLQYECDQLKVGITGASSGCNSLRHKKTRIIVSGQSLISVGLGVHKFSQLRS